MNKGFIFSLILSLLFHFLLLAQIFHLHAPSNLKVSEDFDLLLHNPSFEKTNKPEKKPLNKKTRKKISLESLTPKSHFFGNPTNSKKDSNSSAKDSFSEIEGDSLETMNSIGLQEYSANNSFFEELRIKLARQIQYPQELVEHNIQGTTNFTILINHKGELLQVLESQSLNPYVTTYALIGIHQALLEPLPEDLWFKPQRNFTLTLHFDFRIYTMGNMQEISESRYFKNRFDFIRTRNAPNFLEEFIMMNSRYIPPIVPIPGGFFVDFVQAYRFVKAWQDLEPRMQRQQRLTMTKQKLDKELKVIKAKQSSR